MRAMRSLLILAPMLLASSALAQDGGLSSIDLLEEAEQIISLPGIQRLAVGDPQVADVKNLGSDQVLITGATAGKTTLVAWLKDGQRREFAINVKRGEREAADVEALELKQGELKTLKATGVTGLALGDPRVLEATLRGGRLQLRARGPGRCDVVLVREGGDAKIVVEVAPREGAAVLTLGGVQLKAGQSVALTIEGATGATSKNPASLEAAVPAPGRVSLRALTAGHTTVEATISGRRVLLPVEVVK